MDNDDDDQINDDDLLDEDDLKRPDPSSLKGTSRVYKFTLALKILCVFHAFIIYSFQYVEQLVRGRHVKTAAAVWLKN